jgi:hypothetical protein
MGYSVFFRYISTLYIDQLREQVTHHLKQSPFLQDENIQNSLLQLFWVIYYNIINYNCPLCIHTPELISLLWL